MVSLKNIEFDEEIFAQVYNEHMSRERNKIPVDAIGGFAKYELMAIDNIKLDFDKEDIACLEIGCANGSCLMGLSKMGLIGSGTGIDISSLMIQYAKETASEADFDLTFETSSLESYRTEDKYDIVLLFDVLEHLVEQEQNIQKVHSMLSPGGFLYGSIPDDHTCDSDVHLHYYTMESLHKFLLKYFKRITIIPIDLYEDAPDHYPEIRLFFRCQRSANA